MSVYLCSRKAARIFFTVTILSACWSTLGRAEEASEPQLSDRLMIRGGWAYVWGATANVAIGGPVLGVGANIDFTQTLGGGSSTNAFRFDSLYRFNERHAVGLSWYRVGLSGDKTLNQQIQIADQIIAAGAATQSSLSYNIYRLLYNYSFYRNDKVELGVSPGLYMMQTKFNFSAQGIINNVVAASTTVNEQLTLPLPSIGLVANYNITPKLQFQSRYDFFYLTVGDYTGSMFEVYVGLEYRIAQHFALGTAVDRLSAGLRGSGDNGFNLNFSYNLVYVYATLYAF